jgi:hypothetical protein
MRALLIVLALTACRENPGTASYPDRPVFVDVGDDFLDGSAPWEGQERLSIGAFYEGGATETVVIDDIVTHLYVYDNTFSVSLSTDRVEGLSSDEVVANNVGWVGGGIHWDSPRDLSAWTAMHLALQSENSDYNGLTIGMNGGDVEFSIEASDYGFVPDGEWHDVTISLTDFTGVDTTQVGVALILLDDGVGDGAILRVDDVYLTQE